MCSTASYTEAPEQHRAPKSTHWLNPRGEIQDNSGVQVHFNCSTSSCPVILCPIHSSFNQSVVDVITPPKSQNASSYCPIGK